MMEMNSIGMNVPGEPQRKRIIAGGLALLSFLIRWIRFEEDFDVEMLRWQGLSEMFAEACSSFSSSLPSSTTSGMSELSQSIRIAPWITIWFVD